ncbi:MAG: phosphoribosylanthranilate isomerase [Pleurocapsa minor GSE-CHR-MK-17-07R]|jgi:phosphoribosylanthranilate isomerase|nr:phosphoribosylanthranilate isomerase [Pleurocapsa minor GSE-CHR-MK 17-07R]
MTLVKICGIKSVQDGVAAALAGADMLGINFYQPSPRGMTRIEAAVLAAELRNRLGDRCPTLVGLMVNEHPDTVNTTCVTCYLDAMQLSGDESLDDMREIEVPVFKSVRPQNVAEALEKARAFAELGTQNPDLPSVLIDAFNPALYGGTGHLIDIELAQAVIGQVPRVMIAGGLKPENVGNIVRILRPFAVDVASGVEPNGRAGVKDHDKMLAFVRAVKEA